MTSPRDQFSAVGKAQFEAQFDFFHSMSTRALDSAGRMLALNMAVSRDAVQRSLGVSFALMSARDPREVLALGGQAEEQMRSLASYGRELLGIAGGMRPSAVPAQPLSLAQPQAIEQAADRAALAAAVVATDIDPVAPAAHAVSASAPVSEPVVVAEAAPSAPADVSADSQMEALAAAAPAPVAEPKAIVKALGKDAARAAAAAHPAAASVAAPIAATVAPQVEMPKVAPAPSRRKK